MSRRPAALRAALAAVLAAFTSLAQAGDNATADLTVGAPLTADEQDTAWQFCIATLAHSPRRFADPAQTCGCFPPEWQSRSSRLDRLALRIALDPASPEAKVALGTISHLQGGLHEALLQQLSDAFHTAARQAIDACDRAAPAR